MVKNGNVLDIQNSLIVGRLFNLMHVIQAYPRLAIRQFSVFAIKRLKHCSITIRIMKVFLEKCLSQARTEADLENEIGLRISLSGERQMRNKL